MASTSAWFLGLLAVLCVHHVAGQGNFRLANIFANEMVLQRAPKSAQIWGFGDAGASVSVILGSQQPVQVNVQPDGTWKARLPPQTGDGPYVLQASQSDGSSVTINVWFGDVWVCSGQSNMEMSINQMVDPAGETAKALTYQNLRLMRVANTISDVEQEELLGIDTNWASPNDQNIPGFSALCLMYGERLSDALNNRPIGLIDSTWGGTRIEAWSSQRNLVYCNTPPNTVPNDPNSDAALWNAMIKPLTNMAVRGAIWYQGESNTGYNADYYSCHIQRLAEDWKFSFVDGSVPVPFENNLAFPFGIAQIGPYSGGGPSSYGYVRWHESSDLGFLPNVFQPESFMAATYDTTDPNSPTGDIHPRDKMTVADRLANAAKSFIYGQAFSTNGPTPSGLGISPGEGRVTIVYDRNIVVSGTSGFTALLPDGNWVDATITGSTNQQVDVTFDPTATYLAYAWKGVVCDYKACSIYSNDQEQLPANVWLWKVL